MNGLSALGSRRSACRTAAESRERRAYGGGPARGREPRAAVRAALCAVALLSACSLNSHQSALSASGPQAGKIESLWWFALWTATAVYVVTVAALLYAAFHRRRHAGTPVVDVPRESHRGALAWVLWSVLATVLVLLAFLVVDLYTARSLAALERPRAMHVKVNARQWWWEVQYVDSVPSRTLTTANEIHIPVGRPVLVELTSADVIHSFWVPNLHGKRDNIPGARNRLWIQADTAGVYRGECAEFCGYQHAKMAFLVIAEPQEKFDQWYAEQLADATPPTDSLRKKGQDVFLARACAVCHAVRGTPAAGRVGPDLTHLASRRTLASGTIPNTRGHLGGWVVNAQSIKPGSQMPSVNLDPDELKALLAYLEGLK